MVVYSDQIATSTSEATTMTAMTGSPYSPLLDGRLIQLRLYCGGDAVTSLWEIVTIKLGSSKWGIPVYVSATGSNIRTAPAVPTPVGVMNCDLPVFTGVQITAQIQHLTSGTPITFNAQLLGVFRG